MLINSEYLFSSLYALFSFLICLARAGCRILAWILLFPIIVIYLYDISLYAIRCASIYSRGHRISQHSVACRERETAKRPIVNASGAAIMLTSVQLVTKRTGSATYYSAHLGNDLSLSKEMNGLYGIPDADAGAAKKNESKFQQFKQSPAYPVLLNIVLFGLGAAFIQSPLMDMMAPQL